MGVASDITRRHSLSASLFSSLFYSVPWALGVAAVLGSIAAFWLVVDSVMVSICCKDRFPWWGVTTTLLCRFKGKHFECSQRSHWVSEVVVVGSPPRSPSSLVLGSWLGFRSFGCLSRCRTWVGYHSTVATDTHTHFTGHWPCSHQARLVGIDCLESSLHYSADLLPRRQTTHQFKKYWRKKKELSWRN